MKIPLVKTLIIIALLLLAPLCAEAREINLPLDGTPVTGNVFSTSEPADKFIFTLNELSRVSVKVVNEERLSMAVNGNRYITNVKEMDTCCIYTLDLYQGKHCIEMFSHHGDRGPFTISAIVEKLDVPLDPEPNNGFDSAIPLQLDRDYYGYTPLFDSDFYVFTLDEDSDISVSVDSYGDENYNNRYLSLYKNAYPKLIWMSESNNLYTACLRAGKYYLCVSAERSYSVGYTGGYRVSVSVTGPSTARVSLESPSTMLAGNDLRAYISVTPQDYSISDVVWKSSKPKVLGIRPFGSSCHLDAYNAGTTVLTATLNDRVLKQKIKVKSNGNSRSKPIFGKERMLYTSHKRLYYKNGFLWCESFLTNKTRRTIRKIDGMTGGIYDAYNERWSESVNIGLWKPKTPLRPSSTAVIKYKMPQSEVYFMNLNKWKNHNLALIRIDASAAKRQGLTVQSSQSR